MGMTPYIGGESGVPVYTLAMFGGALVCLIFLFFLKTNEKSRISRLHKVLGAIHAIIIGLVGSKILYIIQSWEYIMSPFGWSFYRTLLSGFVFYGGLIGGALAIAHYCLIAKINIVDFFDFGAIFIPLGTAIGRLGCYFTGCCYGRETHSFLGVPHADGIAGITNGSLVLPVQLFEFGYCMIIFAALVWLSRKERPRGMLTCVYAISYSVCRFINEFFRADAVRGFIGSLSTSQFISVFVFTAASAYVVYLLFKNNKLPFLRLNKK